MSAYLGSVATTANAVVDLRSDTVTRPDAAMRAAMANAEVGDDVYGEDPTVKALEAAVARLLGKESALFVSSGTQGNLAALLAHCGRGDEYLVGDRYHSFTSEAGGAAALGGIVPFPLPTDAEGGLDPLELEAAVKPSDAHYPISRLLCLENTVSGFVNKEMKEAAWNSLRIAGFATVVSTVIATMAALATTRTRPWRGQTAAYMTINMPLMVPEIVTAIATLIFFALIFNVFGISLGIGNLMIAHTVFCIPFAYMPIRARLEDMDKTLEQAAADLYATPWQAFRRVTLPLMMPGVTAGATLAFVVSFDDFTITVLLAGPGQSTLPIYIWTSLRRGISPEINAMSSLLLLVSILLVTVSFVVGRRRK